MCLEDRCPHRCAALSRGRVEGHTLRCGYHGWRFDDQGLCVEVPGLPDLAPSASRAATRRDCRIDGGLVWVWAGEGEGSGELPGRTEVHGTTASFTMDAEVEGGWLDTLENLLDPLHTHFVHPGSVRTEGKRAPVEITVRPYEDGVEAHYAPEPRDRGRIMRLFGGGITTSAGRFRWPCVAELVYDGAGWAASLRGARGVLSGGGGDGSAASPRSRAGPLACRRASRCPSSSACSARCCGRMPRRWDTSSTTGRAGPAHVDQSTEGESAATADSSACSTRAPAAPCAPEP